MYIVVITYDGKNQRSNNFDVRKGKNIYWKKICQGCSFDKDPIPEIGEIQE